MSNFLYAHPEDNIAPNAAVSVQSGAVASGYGGEFLTDLSDVNIGRPALSSGSSISFQLDFGAPVTIAAVVLWSNAQAALDVRFQGNSAAAWGAPAFDAPIVIPGVRPDGYFVKPYADLTQVAGYDDFRYWLLKFPANDVPPGAKLLCLSQLRTLELNPNWNWKQPDLHGSVQMETDGGARWAYDLQVAARGLSASCDWANDTDRAALRAWWQAAGGAVKPFAFIPEPDVNDAWIVRFGTSSAPGRVTSPGIVTPGLDQTRKHFKMTSVPIVVDEVVAGGPEWV